MENRNGGRSGLPLNLTRRDRRPLATGFLDSQATSTTANENHLGSQNLFSLSNRTSPSRQQGPDVAVFVLRL
jgi:hypothetical protein